MYADLHARLRYSILLGLGFCVEETDWSKGTKSPILSKLALHTKQKPRNVVVICDRLGRSYLVSS